MRCQAAAAEPAVSGLTCRRRAVQQTKGGWRTQLPLSPPLIHPPKQALSLIPHVLVGGEERAAGGEEKPHPAIFHK